YSLEHLQLARLGLVAPAERSASIRRVRLPRSHRFAWLARCAVLVAQTFARDRSCRVGPRYRPDCQLGAEHIHPARLEHRSVRAFADRAASRSHGRTHRATSEQLGPEVRWCWGATESLA